DPSGRRGRHRGRAPRPASSPRSPRRRTRPRSAPPALARLGAAGAGRSAARPGREVRRCPHPPSPPPTSPAEYAGSGRPTPRSLILAHVTAITSRARVIAPIVVCLFATGLVLLMAGHFFSWNDTQGFQYDRWNYTDGDLAAVTAFLGSVLSLADRTARR